MFKYLMFDPSNTMLLKPMLSSFMITIHIHEHNNNNINLSLVAHHNHAIRKL
jgi:hypothetical protein